MAARDNINRDLFHTSDLPEEEFMKAPAIHVGTHEQAVERRATIEGRSDSKNISLWGRSKIYSTPISEHAKIYPVTLTDKQANRVHSRFLSQRDIKTTPSVQGSTLGYEGNRNFVENSLIEDRALAAMNRNEVIRYVNNRETPGADADPHSFLVPSPVINMSQMSQRALPMDYSGIVESTVTQRLNKNEHPNAEFSKVWKALKKGKKTIRPQPEQPPSQTKETPRTDSLIDPDVVWPDPQLPDMWRY